jgi:hypothetical protein
MPGNDIFKDELDSQVIDHRPTYDKNKTYTVYVNPINRHIVGFVGFAVGVESLNDGNNFSHYNITDLTEEEYADLSRSINSTECMTFLDVDDRTIIVRRMYIDLLDNTFFDTNINMIYAVDNIATIRVGCVDNTLSTADDVTEIQIKNLKKNFNPVSINGNGPDVVKMMVPNPTIITLELQGDGVHTIKTKAVMPNVQYLWLTAYPQFIKLTPEQQSNLKDWLANNPQK